MRDAKELLKKQDYVQAFEKLWGDTAQIIKAVAFKRGKSYNTMRPLLNTLASFKSLSTKQFDTVIFSHYSRLVISASSPAPPSAASAPYEIISSSLVSASYL